LWRMAYEMPPASRVGADGPLPVLRRADATKECHRGQANNREVSHPERALIPPCCSVFDHVYQNFIHAQVPRFFPSLQSLRMQFSEFPMKQQSMIDPAKVRVENLPTDQTTRMLATYSPWKKPAGSAGMERI